MKKTVFITMAALAFTAAIYGQASFGLKGGVNYNSNGRLVDNVTEAAENPDKAIGYHVGIYAKQDFKGWYIRPELFFTKTSSDYETASFDMSKVDLPVLLGINFNSPFSIFGGPALQYIIHTDLEGFSLSDVAHTFTFGLNAGVGLQISNFGIDLRYERGLTENEVEFTGISEGRIDTRPDQIILSISVKL